MTDFGRFLMLGVATLLLSSVTAQEQDHQVGPEDIAFWVKGADSIVVGTFRTGLPFPWFDGWHYHSQIDVRNRLVPEGIATALNFAWVRPYVEGSLICNDWRPLDGRSGVWFLQKRNDTLRIFGGTTGWCSGVLDLRYLDMVRVAIRDNWLQNKK
jgi:hypothetical protein